MQANANREKVNQFNEFFSIKHEFSVNLISVDATQLPSFEQFIQKIPLPFKISSDIVSLDQAALRPIQGISGVAGHLVEFLNHQSQKIDLLVGYILSQQDEEKCRFKGESFGGGGVVFSASTAFTSGQLFEMKIFLLQDNCAVFCLGEVIDIEKEDECYLHKVIFHYIRDEDREILVRTSLHEQSKQLQVLAQQRNNQLK
jgi:hypothetical protein